MSEPVPFCGSCGGNYCPAGCCRYKSVDDRDEKNWTRAVEREIGVWLTPGIAGEFFERMLRSADAPVVRRFLSYANQLRIGPVPIEGVPETPGAIRV